MGIRVVLAEGESLQQALRRFKKLVRTHDPPGARVERPLHKRPLDHHVKPGELARRRAYWKACNRSRAGVRAEWAAKYGGGAAFAH